MNLIDFPDLATANAYTTYILNNADDLREYLQLNGKWGKLMSHTSSFTDPLYDAACGIVHKIDKAQPISFNPNTVKGSAHIAMLDAFVAAGDLSPADKTAIIALATKTPFATATQEEFDLALANSLLNVPTEPDNIYYGFQDSTEPMYTRGSSKEASKLIFNLGNSNTFARVFDVYVSYDDTGNQNYTERPRVFSNVVIPAGDINKAVEVQFEFRHCRIRVVSKTSGAYNVIVSAA